MSKQTDVLIELAGLTAALSSKLLELVELSKAQDAAMENVVHMPHKPTGKPVVVQKLIRLPEVLSRLGISKSQLYRMVKAGEFPESIQIGRNAVAWPASQVDDWIRNRPTAQSRQE